MARPKKVGLEYFPLDCRMDDKVEILEAEYGLTGFAVYIKLLQEIYQTEDGKLDMSVVFRWKTLGKRMGIDGKLLEEVVNLCLEVGLFCKTCYADGQKLTSNGIQTRLGKVSDLRNKDRSRKNEQSDSFPAENPGKSTQKEREKERDTNVSPKGKNNSSADKSAPASEDVSITHKIRLAVVEMSPEYYWAAKDGKHAKELAEKLRNSYRATKKADPTDEQIVDSLKTLIVQSRKLTPFHHFSNVPKLNEQFNTLVTEIRQSGKNGFGESTTGKKQMVY